MVGICMSCEERIKMTKHEIGNHLSIRELKIKTLIFSFFLFKYIEQLNS